MRANCWFVPVCFAALAVLVGCGDGQKSVTRVKVSGKITLDNMPITTGIITFDPGTGEPPASLDILDGNYEGKAPIGRNIIRISAFRKVSMRQKMGGIDGPGYDEMVEENMLPPRYHSQSNIGRDVSVDGENRFNFDMLTK